MTGVTNGGLVVTAKLTGMEKYEADLEKREYDMLLRIDAYMGRLAQEAAKRMRDRMNAAPSPSPRGSVPGVVTGNLVKGVYAAHAKGTLKAWAGIKAPHAHLLEFGTVKMAARPVVRPTAREVADEGLANMAEALKSGGGGHDGG